MPFSSLASLFLVTSVIVSGLWLSLWQLGTLPFLIIAGMLWALPRLPASLTPAPTPALPRFVLPQNRMPWLIGALLALPALLYLILTWRQEFPFRGDHDFHLGQGYASLGVWRVALLPAVIALAIVYRQIQSKRGHIIAFVVFCLFSAWGYYWMHSDAPPDVRFAVRYPGTFYFLTAPLTLLWQTLELDSPLNAIRLTSALSVLAWLFVLRPLLLRRWPEPAIVPFAIFILLQKDFVYYLASPLIEPWCLVFVALAVEWLIVNAKAPSYPAILLLGFASIIKEPAIFILAGTILGSLLLIQRRTDVLRTLIPATVALTPFTLYYWMRASGRPERPVLMASIDEIFGPGRLDTWVKYVTLQYGTVGAIVAAVCIAVSLWIALRTWPKNRMWLGLWLGAAASVAFVFSEKVMLRWTGYSRTHLIPILVFGAGLIYIGYELVRLKKTKPLWAICGVIGFAHLIVLLPMINTALKPAVYRNFYEYDDCPVYYPVRQLIERGERAGRLKNVSRVRVVHDIEKFEPNYWAQVFPQAYPVLAKKYGLPFDVYREDPSICQCSSPDDAVLAVFIFFTGTTENHPKREGYQLSSAACRAAAERTCKAVNVLEEQGQLIGFLGSMH